MVAVHQLDDDAEDIEALRKAALATLKPKVQTIEQVISSGVSRTKTPGWSEVPASVDFPVVNECYEQFADPVPESSPYPSPQDAAFTHPNLRQPSPSVWRGPFMNGIPTNRFKLPGFQTERRPFHHRPHHRSFGDRGRPLYDRGRRTPRGYAANRGVFPLNNANRGIHKDNPSGLIPPTGRQNLVVESVPVGGNLIVIQPHKLAVADSSTSQNSDGHKVKSTTDDKNSSKLKTEKPSSPKSRLVLPQDRYYSSQSSQQPVPKSASEPAQKKPKDKFSRYDKSDSEEEDYWTDNRSEVDDIAEEIDKFLQDVDQDDAMEKKDAVTENRVETTPKQLVSGAEALSGNSDEEDEVSHRSSPVPSEAESLDLDALASGDPVIGDFEDLDFLVDKEPITDNVSDTLRPMASDVDQNAIGNDIPFSDKPRHADREMSPISSSSSSSSSPTSVNIPKSSREDEIKEDKCVVNNRTDSKSDDSRTSTYQSKSMKLPTKSLSPPAKSPRDSGGQSLGTRSLVHESHSTFRSRSPFHPRTLSPKRLSPRRRSVSPRRSPLRYRRSPIRGRSPRRKSISPLRRDYHRSSSPRRIRSPLRRNTPPRRRPIYSGRPNSPGERRKSPHSRSASPRGVDRYRNDLRSRRDHERPRNFENVRPAGRSRSSMSPSSRSRERRKWPDSGARTISSPNQSDRQRGSGLQGTHHRENSSVGSREINFNGREDPSKGLFMDDKELEKLPPEERAKIEGRRRKFGKKEEVNLEDSKKTVSLKSIKERKKKSKKGEKLKEESLDSKLSESLPKKTDKSGISLKTLRRKMELKKTKHEESSGEEEVTGTTLDALEDDSDDSDLGRAWRLEGNKARPVNSLRHNTRMLNQGLDHRDRFKSKMGKGEDRPRSYHSIHKDRLPKFQVDYQRRNKVLDDDDDTNNSEENILSSRLGSSIVAPRVEIPPEKLRIQIQVSPKDKKKKKSKSKPDFSHVYSVPAKRALSDDNDGVEEEEKVVKKKAKKEKKEKKKKNSKDSLEDTIPVHDAEPASKPRLSILERLGKKVGLETTEKKKKKKKSKPSHLDNGKTDDLDQHIQKMKLKNAAIELRQREIQLDKERYG